PPFRCAWRWKKPSSAPGRAAEPGSGWRPAGSRLSGGAWAGAAAHSSPPWIGLVILLRCSIISRSSARPAARSSSSTRPLTSGRARGEARRAPGAAGRVGARPAAARAAGERALTGWRGLAGCGGPLGAAEGVGVGGGELAGAGEEVADDQELVVAVGGQQVAGLAHELAEDFLVAGGGDLGDLHHEAAAVTGGGPAAAAAGARRAVQDGGDAAGGEAEQAG